MVYAFIYGYIIVKSLTCVSNVAYTYLSFDWVESFDKLKRALSCIPLMTLFGLHLLFLNNFISMRIVPNYLTSYEPWSILI